MPGLGDRARDETIDASPWLRDVDLTLAGSGTRWPSGVAGALAGFAVDGQFGGSQPWEEMP